MAKLNWKIIELTYQLTKIVLGIYFAIVIYKIYQILKVILYLWA